MSNDCSVVAVWDAAGQGKAAATDALVVGTGLRALLSANPDIVRAVSALNRVLFRRAGTLPPWPFVSGFFGLVNPRSHTLRYISCGHETAIIFRGRGAHVHLPNDSPLLGLSEAADLMVQGVVNPNVAARIDGESARSGKVGVFEIVLRSGRACVRTSNCSLPNAPPMRHTSSITSLPSPTEPWMTTQRH